MMAKFDHAFGSSAMENKEIPEEVLVEPNKELLGYFAYIKDKQGSFLKKLGPDSKVIDIEFQYDDASPKKKALYDRILALPKQNQINYICRLQRNIPVKSMKIIDETKDEPSAKVINSSISNNIIMFNDCKICPEKFQYRIPVRFEMSDGSDYWVIFKQRRYDSYTELRLSNENNPALKFDLYLYSPLSNIDEENAKTNIGKTACITYFTNLMHTNGAKDAIDAIKLFKELYCGTAKVNEVKSPGARIVGKHDLEEIDGTMAFWKKVDKLEKILGVSFSPKGKFPFDERELFDELTTCLIDGNSVIMRHPTTNFRITEHVLRNTSVDPDKLVGKNNVDIRFLEGPIKCKLLGAKFEIYSQTIMRDFVITKIEWDDITKQSGRIYFEDAPGKTWVLERRLMTKSDADAIEMKK